MHCSGGEVFNALDNCITSVCVSFIRIVFHDIHRSLVMSEIKNMLLVNARDFHTLFLRMYLSSFTCPKGIVIKIFLYLINI